MNFFLRAANILSFASGKAAVGVLILRLMGPIHQWQRWVVWVVIVLTAIINILNCIFNFVQCRPIQANWDQDLPHRCWPSRVQLDFAYFMSGASRNLLPTLNLFYFYMFLFYFIISFWLTIIGENILADMILAILPVTIFWDLQVRSRKRIYITVVLSLGSM